MPRVFSLRRDTPERRAFFRAVGLPMPVTHDLNPRERRARTFAAHADALAAQAVALWQRTRRRLVTLDEAMEDGLVVAARSGLVTFDRFA